MGQHGVELEEAAAAAAIGDFERASDPTILVVRTKQTAHNIKVLEMVTEWLVDSNMQAHTDFNIEGDDATSNKEESKENGKYTRK